MEKQEVLDLIASIGTCDDEVQRREALATLTEEATALFDASEKLTTSNQSLTADNEKLREANMKLFLRVGESKSGADVMKDSTGIDTTPKEKRKFEDLFNEKGGLK
jgi:hypothetical protein